MRKLHLKVISREVRSINKIFKLCRQFKMNIHIQVMPSSKIFYKIEIRKKILNINYYPRKLKLEKSGKFIDLEFKSLGSLKSVHFLILLDS